MVLIFTLRENEESIRSLKLIRSIVRRWFLSELCETQKDCNERKTQSRRRKVCRWLTVAHATGAIRHIDISALARSPAVAGWRLVTRSPSRVRAVAPTHRPCRPSGPSAVHNWREKKRKMEIPLRSELLRRVRSTCGDNKKLGRDETGS